MEERIRTIGKGAWWLVGILLVVTVIGYLGWVIRVVFPPMVLAGIIVFLCNPIVTRLHARGIPRVIGTSITYLGFFAVLTAIGFLIAPLIANQFDELSEKLPQARADVEERIEEYHDRSIEDDWFIKIPTVSEIEDSASGGDEQDLAAQVTTFRKLLTRAFHTGLIFVLGPIVAFYMLVDLPDIRRSIEALIPEKSKPRVLFLAHRLNLIVGGFFRGQLAVAFIVGVMVSIGLGAIVRLPLWLVVGMVAGLFNIIPLIGPYIGAVPGIIIALATKDLKAAIGVAAVMTAAQQIDNHFITPYVMRRAVQLHPAAVVMALLVFGTLGGFFGLLLAVPLTASMKVLGGHLWRRYIVGVSIPGLDEPLDPEPPPEAQEGEGIAIA